MDSNNWRPNPGTEPTIDTSEWRAQLQPDSRQRIVNKIMDTLKKHLPVSGSEGLLELWKIAQRFEEKIFTAATSQSDYLRKISMKMLTMETKSQSSIANNMPSNEGGPSNKPPDQGFVLQSQALNQGQQHPNPLPSQHQPRQQLLSQTIQNNVAPQPNLPSVSSLSQNSGQNINQNSNTQPGQNSAGNTIGHNSNVQSMFSGSQRQMPGRQQVVPQQQQQSQNQQHILYPQQLLKQKFQMSQMQQQQQQQNLLQPNQLQSSQQSVMQPSMLQSSLSSLPQNQQSNNVQQSTQSRLQQHSQIIRQQQLQQQNSIAHQQQTPMAQQQQQQQLVGTQSNATNGPHAQLLGQQNNVGDTQKSQRLLSQQNNLMNLQQRQQLMNQQNNLTNIHQQQLGNNVPGSQQQQQLFGTESGNQGIQTSHHSAHMLQQSKVSMQQQLQQNASKLLPSHLQQSQPQASQQQLMSQIHNQPTQMQQQLGLQQQPNTLQRDMQQKLQASGSLLQQQSVLDQQKQLYQSQRALPETSTTSVDSTTQTGQPSGVDWQEEVYQKMQTMKENYLPDMNEMCQKISLRLQQHDSNPQQPKSDQIEKLRAYKMMLERMIAILQIPKNSILPSFREKLGSYEKQIVNLINSIRPRRSGSSLQPGQLPPTHVPSMQQSQSQTHQMPQVNQMSDINDMKMRQGMSVKPGVFQPHLTSDGAYGNALAATSGKSTAEQPLERLVRAVQSMSTKTLSAAVNDISSVVSMTDRIAGSAPGNGSRAAVGEDLVSITNCRLQARNFTTQDGSNGTKKIKRYISSRPLKNVSSAGSMNDSINQFSASEASQQKSTASSNFTKPKAEVSHALLEEIRQINCRLIDTVVDICDEDVDPTIASVTAAEGAEGTIVKCSFIPVALSPSLKCHYASLQSPIQPLRLLVPQNYPNCSPIFLDKLPVESCKGNADLTEKAKLKFSVALRSVSQPFSVKDIAKTWDSSARGAVSDYAQQFGGGTFSSKYGTWEDCLAA
ncbi:mediator of RNA polymerase II transcription subunit 15a-like [Cicer arietinum]